MKKFIVCLAVVAVVIAWTIPAMAETSLYGNARIETFMVNQTDEYSPTGFDDSDLLWGVGNYVWTARLGFKFKNENLGGHVEIRPYATTGLGSMVRHLNGTWNFGAGTLLVGQSWTPITFFPANQVYTDAGLGGYGALPCGRKSGFQLFWKGLKLGLLEPNAPSLFGASDTDTKLPKIEAAYSFKTDMFTIAPLFGYNSYDVVDGDDSNEAITSMIYGVYFRVAHGPFMVAGNYYQGKNLGTYGDLGGANVHRTPLLDADNNVEDTTEVGYAVKLNFKISDMASAEVGYGSLTSDNDLFDDPDQVISYYVQVAFQPVKGFNIIPEIGKIDKKDDRYGNSQGDLTYYGVKWQINF